MLISVAGIFEAIVISIQCFLFLVLYALDRIVTPSNYVSLSPPRPAQDPGKGGDALNPNHALRAAVLIAGHGDRVFAYHHTQRHVMG